MKLVQILYLTILVASSVATNLTRVEGAASHDIMVCPGQDKCISKTSPNCPIQSPLPFNWGNDCWVCCWFED
ncbi:uncharacterized protein EDB93DRAFT_1159565 [Suillus bovinus]|uniref:uncharacterized protein n=1 Tax=Suillus bovinus TaxID=48563 RepID=UPI001B876E55|nr:uncharacterized protein EDB93DRAFT_1159565 [Suillus bovinus]KAG2141395.1 hypothetical protein EDB93DRAFT_1159565 [Suillus bovinus]